MKKILFKSLQFPLLVCLIWALYLILWISFMGGEVIIMFIQFITFITLSILLSIYIGTILSYFIIKYFKIAPIYFIPLFASWAFLVGISIVLIDDYFTSGIWSDLIFGIFMSILGLIISTIYYIIDKKLISK